MESLSWNAVFAGFLQWIEIFGGIMGIVLLVILPVSLIAGGGSGPKTLFRYIFHNQVTRTGGLVGGILGPLLGGLLGWFNGPQIIENLSRFLTLDLDFLSPTTRAAIGLLVIGLLGLIIGPVTLAATFDSLDSSPRRVWALTILTLKESWGRKLIWVFAVFVVLFMFAAWFLPRGDFRADLQVKNYISTALFPITWLPLLVVMLLACWGLPEDIKRRSVHTVVTKPVRRNEILLGRILGLTCVGTFLLVVMSGVGYIWILRQVPPKIAEERLICRIPVEGDIRFLDRTGNPTSDGINVGDEDQSRKYIEGGTGCVAIWKFHDLSEERLGNSFLFESRFRAFRLHKGDMNRSLMGQLRLVKRLRRDSARDLGNADPFKDVRGHIEAGAFSEASTALAVVADGLGKNQIPLTEADLNSIAAGYRQFALLMEPFQETKSNASWIEELISAAREVSDHAEDGNTTRLDAPLKQIAKLFAENSAELQTMLVDIVAVPPDGIFNVEEFGENILKVNRKIAYRLGDSQEMTEGDVFGDILHGGDLQVEVICLDTGQFLGMARPDLFIRAKDNPFAVGFSKAVFGIWLMLVLIIMLGVTGSCFVKGPVGILLTLTLLVVGSFFHGFLERVVQGELEGGGAIESARRLVEHLNPKVQLEDSRATQVMRTLDKPLTGSLWLVHKIIPNFNTFRMSEWVAEGFDVPLFGKKNALIPGVLMTLAYLLPCLLVGFYSLKLRELESK